MAKDKETKKKAVDLDQVYDVLDEMKFSSNYIPTISELNEYHVFDNVDSHIPYFLNLQERLFEKKKIGPLSSDEKLLLEKLNKIVEQI